MRKFHRDSLENDAEADESAYETIASDEYDKMQKEMRQVQEISILQALPQRGTSNEPPTSAGNMAREASDDAKYVFNGLYKSNSIFSMTFPSLLMRPELVASYAEVRFAYFYDMFGRKISPPYPLATSPPDFGVNKPFRLDSITGLCYYKAAKTLPRRVDDTGTRNGPQKTNLSTSIRTTTKEEIKDDSVKFPTNRPSNGGNANQPVSPVSPVSVTRNKIVDEIALDPRDMKKCQQNFRDCEKLNYYPTNVVEKLLSEGKINKNLLFNENIKFEINTRLEGSGDDGSGKKQFCSYKEDIMYPDAGKNKDGEYRFIVQLPKYNITQGIRTETCVSGDNSCGGLKTHLPSYYQLECVQKYAYKQLVTFSSTGSVQEPIEIPSCCVCMYSDKK
ncbi:uncharacterized protein LOC135849025 isoform X2 [Planococcus citri]|uniref:uncharacterized protein LOC135849025 isoform X2 n=1 Tax=Planococcus citri TaxID=170843 RepID=UPI0031F73D0E